MLRDRITRWTALLGPVLVVIVAGWLGREPMRRLVAGSAEPNDWWLVPALAVGACVTLAWVFTGYLDPSIPRRPPAWLPVVGSATLLMLGSALLIGLAIVSANQVRLPQGDDRALATAGAVFALAGAVWILLRPRKAST